MNLTDAIESWGLDHRDRMTDPELRRLGKFWAVLNADPIGKKPVVFLTDDELETAAGLFAWTDKADVLELLEAVRGWHLSRLKGETPAPRIAPTPPAAAATAPLATPPAPAPAAAPQPVPSQQAAPAAQVQPDADILPAVSAFTEPLAETTPVDIPLSPTSEQPVSTDIGPIPGTVIETSHTRSAANSKDRRASEKPATSENSPGRDSGDRRLLQLAAALALGIVVVGLAITLGIGGNDPIDQEVAIGDPAGAAGEATAADAAAQEAEVLPATVVAEPSPEVPTLAPPTPEPDYPPLESLPERGGVLRNGQLILEGAVPSQEFMDEVVTKATEVMGPDAIVNNYVIHPDAPGPTTTSTVRVEQGILFELNSTTILPQFTPILELGVILLTTNPDVTLLIEGHTDSAGDPAYNRELSLGRAQSVVDWIVANGGIAPERLEARGFGADQPIADNSTDEGMAINRRIEVVVFGLLG